MNEIRRKLAEIVKQLQMQNVIKLIEIRLQLENLRGQIPEKDYKEASLQLQNLMETIK